MKKMSAKKVFAIIGIILGSVTTFVGGVVGVMALTGKFKTPVVYPTVLEFAISEEVVIEDIPYGEQVDDVIDEKYPTLYSFKLLGSNPGEEHEVNQKDCYLWFEDENGSKLITLCDRDGKPLEDSNGRYLVQCNEPIYYMINKVADDYETTGKVVLNARSTNETLKKPEPKIIWIDRSVQGVFVKDSDWSDGYFEKTIVADANMQNINVGAGFSFGFSYYVNTPLSLSPIAKESAKEIELYYDSDETDDYIRVTKEEVENTESPLNSILTYDEENRVFEFVSDASEIENHTFYIAVFKTYKAKEDYLSSIEGLTINNPNYHRIKNGNMAVTTLNVKVDNVEISEVGFKDGADVNLNVHSENDYIYINDGTQAKNDLGLYMNKVNESGDEVADYSRFDYTRFVKFDEENVWSTSNAVFNCVGKDDLNANKVVNISRVGEVVTGTYKKDENADNDIEIEFALTNIKLSENLTIIKLIRDINNYEYCCSNGVAVLDETEADVIIKLLNPGVYLSFYSKGETVADPYVVSDFDYEVTQQGTGTGISWNIISKSIPENNDKLALGVLVVNSTGIKADADFSDYFAVIDATVSEEELTYTKLQENVDLDIGFTEDNYMFDEEEFNKIINITAGSYKACVLAVPETTIIIDKIDNIKFEILKDNYYKVVVAPYTGGTAGWDDNKANLYVLDGDNYLKVANDATYDGGKTYCKLTATTYVYTADTWESDKDTLYVLNNGNYNKITGETQTYVLVGYIDESGNFVNNVRINENVSEANKSCKLSMIQLKNDLNEDVYKFINAVYAGTKSLDGSDIKAIYNDIVTVNSKYLINDGLLTAEHYLNGNKQTISDANGNIKVYENNTITLAVKSSNPYMLEKITKFYVGDEITFAGNLLTFASYTTQQNYTKTTDSIYNESKTYYSLTKEVYTYNLDTWESDRVDLYVIDNGNYIKVANDATYNDSKTYCNLTSTTYNYIADTWESDRANLYEVVHDSIKIEYTTGTYAEGNNVTSINLTFGDNDPIVIAGVSIQNGSPSDIVLRYDSDEDGVGDAEIELKNSKSDATTDASNITVSVSYDESVYKYAFTVNGKVFDFNTEISSDATAFGFQDKEDKGQNLAVDYKLYILDSDYKILEETELDTSDFTGLANYANMGTYRVLGVKIGSTEKFIKFKFDVEKFVLISTKNIPEEDSECYLKDYVTFIEKTEYTGGADGWDINKTNLYIVDNGNYVKVANDATYDDSKTYYFVDFITPSLANLVEIEPTEVIYGNGSLNDDYDDATKKWTYSDSDAQPVLTIENDETNGWKFRRTNSNILLKVTFNVKTFVGSEELKLEFTSDVTISVNSAWSNREIYAGTTVQVLNNGDLDSEYSVIKVVQSGSDIITYSINNETNKYNNEYTFTDSYIGQIYIKIYINDIYTLQFAFTVKPNVVATKRNITLESERTVTNSNAYLLSDLYDLSAYDTTITYGSDANTLYSNVAYLTGTPTGLTFKVEQATSPELTGGETLQIGSMEQLKVSIKREITLIYTSGKTYNVSTDSFEIHNKYDEDLDVDDEDLTFNALEEYENFASVSGFTLDNIKVVDADYDYITFSVEGTNFTIDSFIVEETTLEVILIFKKGNQILTYQTTITILPYVPETKTFGEVKSGTSESDSVDLLAHIYDIASIKANTNINKLMIVGIQNEEGEDISSSILTNWNNVGGGYVKDGTDKFNVKFAEISGDKLPVKVMFEITYSDNKTTYTYPVLLTIKNRQAISAQYPESDKTAEVVIVKFLDDCEADELELAGSNSSNKQQRLENLNYEPVLIYSNKTTEINFKHDEIKLMSRIETDSDTLEVKLVAYQTVVGMLDYVKSITTAGGCATLPSFNSEIFGILIFKITTKSGNYAYYNVRIYCYGEQTSKDSSNNIQVVAYDNENNTMFETNAGDISYQITATTTYKDLVNSISSKMTEKLGMSYNANTMKIYLYNGETTGGEFDSSNYFTEVSDKIITLDAKFNTITLGIIYKFGNVEYMLGTITVFVQPKSTAVNATVTDQFIIYNANGTTFDYELPNGYFTADVPAGATEIDSPFGTGWTAQIVEINGVTYDETQHADFTYSASVVNMSKRVDKNTIIYVKYSNNDTIAYVTYTYKATTIPTQTSVYTTIGEFNNGIFVKTINLAEGNNKEKFFGTYNYSIVDDSITTTDSNCSISGTTLTFTQTHQEQFITIKITYSKFGTSGASREFIFRVLPGVNFAQDTGNVSGSTSSNRLSTTVTNNYESETGSTLYIEKTETGDMRSYKITGGGLTISTHAESILVLTFDEVSYVLNNATVTDDFTINFAHTAEDRPIKMTITVKTSSGDVYGSIDFYINVVQTYSFLEATYVTSGATHENVASGTSVGLTTLFTGNKFKLYKPDGETAVATANLGQMGFSISGNPNEIQFSTMANGTINSSSQITFASVSTNTECVVLLKNEAGITYEGVDVKYNRYTYQIMAVLPTGKTDGLDYSSTDGYDGTKETTPYVSYMLEDYDSTKAYAKKFVLGTMKDLENTTVFTASTSGTVNGPTKLEDATPASTNGGYINAIQYSTTSGNYQIYITLDLNTRKVELYLTRDAGKATSDIDLTLSLGGVNGAGTIISELQVIFSNDKIERNTEVIDTVYADNLVKLFEDSDSDGKYDNGKFIENGGTNAPTLTYELAQSSYIINYENIEDRKPITILANETENDLFTYSEIDKSLDMEPVGCDVSATVNFVVKKNNYVITAITYQFTLKLNMHIMVNGEALNISNDTPETYFVLTNKETKTATTSSSFPITKTFVSSVASDDDYVVDASSGTEYYKVLAFNLYKIRQRGSGTSYKMSNSLVVIEDLYPNSSDCYELLSDGSGIKFIKDFSGDITLKLSVPTDNGTYSIVWTIYVTGIFDLSYANASAETKKIDNNGIAFNSGASVDIISSNTGTADSIDVGIKSTTSSTLTSYIDYSGKEVSYEYKVNIANTDNLAITNQQLFDLSNPVGSGSATDQDMGTSTNFSLTLPNVPSTTSDEQQAYYVTYKIYVEYLGLTYSSTESANKVKVFYVTYKVINIRDIKTYVNTNDGNNPSANVLVEDRVDSTNLDLFYYKQIYNTYSIIYTGGAIKLSSNNGSTYDKTVIEYAPNPQASNESYLLDVSNSKLYDPSGTLIGTMTSTPNYVNSKKYSVFQTNFSNIFEFKEFIDTYLNKKSVKLTKANGSVHEFTLKEITNGRYGIDLNENTATDGKLFNNEMKAELALVDNGMKTLIVDAYSSSYTSGFRLYSNKAITANSNYKLSDLFLDSYVTINKVYEKTSDTSLVKGKTYYTFSSSKYTAVTKPDVKNISTYYEDVSVTFNTSVIGVGTPTDLTWVTGATGIPNTTSDTTTYATISIPNGSENNIYKVKKVTYTGIGGGSYYSISESFYYIDLNGNLALVVPDYLAVGYNETYFKLTYNPNTSGNVEIDLTKAFKVWVMDSGKLKANSASTFGDTATLTCSDSTITGNKLPLYSKTSKKISISSSILDAYKLAHPNKKNYPEVTATLTVNGISLIFKIEFGLYSYSKVSVNHTAGSTDNFVLDLTTLANKLHIPEESGYVELNNSNKGKVVSVAEKEFNDYLVLNAYGEAYDSDSGKITLKGESINSYFTANPTATTLKFICVLTTADGTLEFEVTVNNNNAN